MLLRNVPFLLIAILSGCTRTPRVPVEDDPSIRFPQFFEQVAVEVGAKGAPYELDGVTLRALMLAANDFLPPGGKNRPCEYTQEAQRYRILRQGDIIFVYIYEDNAYCGFRYTAMDSGVRYAISTDGRILRRLFDGEPEEPLGPVDLDAGGWVPARPGTPSGYDDLLSAPPSSSHPEPGDGGTTPSRSVPSPAPVTVPDAGPPGKP